MPPRVSKNGRIVGRNYSGRGYTQCHGCELFFPVTLIKRHRDECPALHPTSDEAIIEIPLVRDDEEERASLVQMYTPQSLNEHPGFYDGVESLIDNDYNTDDDEENSDFNRTEINDMSDAGVEYHVDDIDFNRRFRKGPAPEGNINDDKYKHSKYAKYNREEGIEDAPWHHPKRVGRPPIDFGLEKLIQVAGSKGSRDFRRRAHFMSPKAFEEWQKNKKKKLYWAEETDLDDDSEDEFVVRFNRTDAKGKVIVDEHGNPIPDDDIAAINGWTTVKSDYKERRKYIDAYPTPKDRKGKPFKKFMEQHYLTDEYTDAYGYPNHKYLEKREKDMYEEGYKRKLHMPNKTARQDFMKGMVWRAYKAAVDDFVSTKNIERGQLKEILDQVHGTGWVTKLGSKLWEDWIITPFMEEQRGTPYYAQELEKYKPKFNRAPKNKERGIEWSASKPEHVAAFEKTLFKKDSIRTSINRIVSEILNEDGIYFESAIQRIYNKIVKKIMTATEGARA